MNTFRVPEMSCGQCASTISRAIASIDKSARIHIRIHEQLVRINSTATAEELAQALSDAGFATQEIQAEPARHLQASTKACGCCCNRRETMSLDDRQVACMACH